MVEGREVITGLVGHEEDFYNLIGSQWKKKEKGRDLEGERQC